MVACLFARAVYTDELLAMCLNAVGYGVIAENLASISRNIQQLRWKDRFATGFRPEEITIPKRFYEITTIKGPLDGNFLNALTAEYARAIRALGD